jgi:hypothetical protein
LFLGHPDLRRLNISTTPATTRIDTTATPTRRYVLELAVVTARENVPLLTALMESPLYDAVKVTLPALAPVTVIEHALEARTHIPPNGVGRATLPVPDCVKMNVPLGDDPFSVAVHNEVEPTTRDLGVQETAVVVGTLVTVKGVVVEPELPWLPKSPA